MSKISSIKHKEAKRAHIPSKEEAGMENANENVKQNGQATYPINPVILRGQDPELFWLNKYGNDDREQLLKIDIRSLYRHEHISPELLINNLYKIKEGQSSQLDMYSLFGNNLKMDELDKVADYYKYSDDWKNRLIQGDSLLVMASLLEREGMAGKVQTGAPLAFASQSLGHTNVLTTQKYFAGFDLDAHAEYTKALTSF